MSASNIVYRKTAAGLAEMQARRLHLPRKTFSLLLAVDGQRSRTQLCSTLSAFGDVAAQLEQLEEMGLIEDGDARAGGGFSFAAPLPRRRDESAGARWEPARGGASEPEEGPVGDETWAPTTRIQSAGPQASGRPPALPAIAGEPPSGLDDDAGFDTESTTTWAVTELGPSSTTLVTHTLPGDPERSVFVELGTWSGGDLHGGAAPTWPKTISDAPVTAPASSPGHLVPASPGLGVEARDRLVDGTGFPAGSPGQPPMPAFPVLPVPPAAPPAPNSPAPGSLAPGSLAPPASPTSPLSPPLAPGPVAGAQPGSTGGPAHPGRLPPLAATLQDARLPGGFNGGPAAGQAGAVAGQGPGLPSVAPLPPWSMPPAPQPTAQAEPQYPMPIDRSRTYPAEYNLIDIRAYIGVGSQRVDPLANVREAMAHVIARHIDLQNYELLHAIESMQSRDELMRLLPYYLVDLDRRLAPADYQLHVENLSRLSGLTTDALLALMTQRKGPQAAG